MKIAYIANIKYPSNRAHTVQITHMSQAFCNNEHLVTLFVNKRSAETIENVRDFFDIPILFKLERISHGLFYPYLKAAFYLSEFWFSAAFLLQSKRNNFDIFYSRQEWVVWFLSFFIDDSKLVWESHEAKFNLPAKKILTKGIKTVVISEGIYDFYIKNRIAESQMIVAHDGVDDTFFENLQTKGNMRQELDLPLEAKVAMYIGGFDEWKGAGTFFSASDSCPDVIFVAIGGTASQISSYSRDYPKVKFLGQLPYSQLKNNQQAADVLVIPNSGKSDVSTTYTSPLKLFAYMASGIPIVASNLPSVFRVTGEKLVTLVPPDKPEDLGRCIQSVFVDYDQKKALAQELKEVALCYTWNQRAKNIINFISH